MAITPTQEHDSETGRMSSIPPANERAQGTASAISESSDVARGTGEAAVQGRPKARRVANRDRGFTAAELSPRFRARIFLEFVENPSTDRIADRFHVPRMTVIEAVLYEQVRRDRRSA